MNSAVMMGVCCGIAAGLAVAEISALTPALARMIVRRAARSFYADDADLAAQRAEEWQALIQARPGNILKLATAAFFGGGAAALAIARTAGRARQALLQKATREQQNLTLLQSLTVLPTLAVWWIGAAGVASVFDLAAGMALFGALILISSAVVVIRTVRRRKQYTRIPPK
ncbi:hypothetical protein [Actinomadura sp. NPDC049753]|uniref:hypothetical protein n=1 Tax=Actinomadura sp. NPDC049753 TaxID=3154739 RepID=UPI003417B691